MNIKRKAYEDLILWKKKKAKTALLVNGARRVGKSFLVEEFAKNEFKSYIKIDFDNIEEVTKDIILNDSHNLDIFFKKLEAIYSTKLYIKESVIIFDEVQKLPKARELIKYLVADGRYYYIETGSLLSLKMNTKDIIIPSEEEQYNLYPLTFDEFLVAKNESELNDYIKDCFENRRALGQALSRKSMNLFKEYMLVGGMPKVVDSYIETKDFKVADDEKNLILNLYRNDIVKFAGVNAMKVFTIFDNIPSQLGKENKKFILSNVKSGARYREYENAFMWLSESMVINICYNTVEPSYGLSININDAKRKVYMADTGLLVTFAFLNDNYEKNDLYNDILIDKLSLNVGMIYENVVAQILASKGIKLYYFSRYNNEKKRNDIELDFLYTKNRKVNIIEVKSSKIKTIASLENAKKSYKNYLGESIVISSRDFEIKDGIIYLPIYMTYLL